MEDERLSTRALSEAEAETIAEAIQLVRNAGFEAKANLLDDMLEEGNIKLEPELPANIPGRRANYPWPLDDDIELGPIHFDAPIPFSLSDARIILLAATLMHEANHVMGHGEIEAWGNTIVFLERLAEGLAKYFPGLDESARKRFKERIDEELDIARKKRKEHAREAGKLFGLNASRTACPAWWRSANGLRPPVESARKESRE